MPEARTMEEWLVIFDDSRSTTIPQLAEVILNNIDGYGVEYGFEVKDDARDLLAAYRALNVWILKTLSPEMKVKVEKQINKLNAEAGKA